MFYNGGGCEGCIPLTRDSIPFYADEACVESCQSLYDLNIQTVYSGANVNGQPNNTAEAFIGISYDTLSEENKEIVKNLIDQGIIEGIKDLSGREEGNVITISTPIKSDDLVGDVSDKLLFLSKQFVQQDVLYGRTTEEEIRKHYPLQENGEYFDRFTLGTLTKEELEERISEEISSHYCAGDEYLYVTQDLCDKHRAYTETKKEGIVMK